MYFLSESYTQTSPLVMLQSSHTVTKMFLHDVVPGNGYTDSIIVAETTDRLHSKMTREFQTPVWIVAKLVTRID